MQGAGDGAKPDFQGHRQVWAADTTRPSQPPVLRPGHPQRGLLSKVLSVLGLMQGLVSPLSWRVEEP